MKGRKISDVCKNQMKKVFKRIKRICITVFLLTVAFVLFTNIYTVAKTKDCIFSPEEFALAHEGEKYDCIIILGAGVRSDGTPSLMLEERLSCGLELYQKGFSGKIIVSGDHGSKNYDEVNAMKAWLVEKGVPSDDIFMDHAGFSTYDSIYRARAIFMAGKVCVVSQKYHLYRALYLADALSLDAFGIDAQKTEFKGYRMRELREVAARSKDFVSAIFKPKPVYLGEVIPVFGDGNITNDIAADSQ